MIKEKEIEFLDYKVYSGALHEIPLDGGILINTINQYSFCIAERDKEFKTALAESDILLPDGIGVTMASKFLNNKKIKKIAGADIHKFLLEELNRKQGKCFYLGASQSTLDKITVRLAKEYPNIQVNSFSPPFKPSFSKAESKEMIGKVNAFYPDVLFVGMTAPKQEKWAFTHKRELNAKVICSIGAVFDFYAGTVNRTGQIWIDLGLEWFGRFLREPKRMWKRYINYGFIYVFLLTKERLSVRNKK